MKQIHFICFLICAGGMVFSASDVQAGSDNSNPFVEHILIGDGIYTRNASQFTPYSGPSLPASDPDIVEFKRIGLVSITPSKEINIELVTWPMSRSYVLKDATTGKPVHKFSYYGDRKALLYFAGDGVLYEHAVPPSLCWGAVTRKFNFIDGKFIEVIQSSFQINAETEVLHNAKLLSIPGDLSSESSTVLKGEKVTVLKYKAPNHFLIKTPLGHTGWLDSDRSASRLSITRCE